MPRRSPIEPMSMDRVATVLKHERLHRRDVYLPWSKIRVRMADNPLVPLVDRYRLEIDDKRCPELRFTPTSLRQLCNLAGVPEFFLDKVPSSLALNLIRCMLEVSDSVDERSYLLRLREEKTPRLRAILPAGFVRLDDEEVLDTVSARVEARGVQVCDLNVTEDMFAMRFIFPDGEVNLGSSDQPDEAFVGLDVRSSETGRYPIEVRHVLFRVVCSNGMTQLAKGHRALRRRNTGLVADRFRSLVAETLDDALDRGREMGRVLADARSDYVKDPVEEARGLFRRYRLGSPTGAVARWVVNELVRGGALSVRKFDLVQAFTAVARGLEARDRVKVEDAMGAYLFEKPSLN